MTHEYRLNIEDIFWRTAEENWQKAQEDISELHESVWDENGEEQTVAFDGFWGEALAQVSIAVVSWAISLEATINLAWQASIYPILPQEGDIPKILLQKLSSIEKLREILRASQVNIGKLSWWEGTQELFRCRNKIVHCDPRVKLYGSCAPPEIKKDLRKDNVQSMREAATAAIRKLGELNGNLRIGFLDGEYELEIAG